MIDISVSREFAGYQPSVVYDVNIMVLIHGQPPYAHRVACMKRFGLLDTAGMRVHLTLVASPGDGKRQAELRAGWPAGAHVTLLEMATPCAGSKVHGYYLWLQGAPVQARWHLRVDDDSITDVRRLLRSVDARYGGMAVHVMTSPHEQEIGIPIFKKFLRGHAREVFTPMHEYESSISSAAAMRAVFADPEVVHFLAETGRLFAGPGDRALALAMQMVGVPLAKNFYATHQPESDSLSLVGGQLQHVHYINWNDPWLLALLDGLIYGDVQPVSKDLLPGIFGRELEFGRCPGPYLNKITLLEDGRIANSSHTNETFWKYRDGCLLFQRADEIATTAFRSLLSYQEHRWLIGPCLYKQTMHALLLSAGSGAE